MKEKFFADQFSNRRARPRRTPFNLRRFFLPRTILKRMCWWIQKAKEEKRWQAKKRRLKRKIFWKKKPGGSTSLKRNSRDHKTEKELPRNQGAFQNRRKEKKYLEVSWNESFLWKSEGSDFIYLPSGTRLSFNSEAVLYLTLRMSWLSYVIFAFKFSAACGFIICTLWAWWPASFEC